MYDIKEKSIGNNTFYVSPFPPLISLGLLGDIQAVITTSLGNNNIANGNAVADSDEKSLLDKDINMGAVIAGIGNNLKGPALVQFAERILLTEMVSVKCPGETEAVKLTKGKLNEIFAGHIKDMLELMYFVLEVNYADFFEKMPNLTGILAGIKEITQSQAN